MRLHTLSLCLIALAFTPNLAAHPVTAGIAVQFEGTDVDWRYSDASVRSTHLNTASVSWYEDLGNHFVGGMHIGYMEGTQADNPIPAARVMTGKWLDLDFQYFVFDKPTVGLMLSLNYRYAEINGTQDTQIASWRWHRGTLGTTLRLGPTQGIYLILGLTDQAISGEEVLTGPTIQVEKFKANQHVGTHLGLNLSLDHTGRISIEMQSGAERGGRVTFGRWF